jgi:hypothetical protein
MVRDMKTKIFTPNTMRFRDIRNSKNMEIEFVKACVN